MGHRDGRRPCRARAGARKRREAEKRRDDVLSAGCSSCRRAPNHTAPGRGASGGNHFGNLLHHRMAGCARYGARRSPCCLPAWMGGAREAARECHAVHCARAKLQATSIAFGSLRRGVARGWSEGHVWTAAAHAARVQPAGGSEARLATAFHPPSRCLSPHYRVRLHQESTLDGASDLARRRRSRPALLASGRVQDGCQRRPTSTPTSQTAQNERSKMAE
jgi:hypothetical protein